MYLQNNNRKTFQNVGQYSINNYNANMNNYNLNQQMLEEDYRRRLQQRQQYLSMQHLLYDQNQMMNQMVYQQQYQQYMQQQQYLLQQQQRQYQKPINVQLKSITLKPLEYYSQQMSSIHYPPYQQPYQKQVVEIPEQQERVHAFKPDIPTRTIEVQTDDKITEYEKFARMGLANTINKQTEDAWGPKTEETNQQFLNQNYQGNFELNIQADKEKQKEQDKQQQYQRKRFKPAGMTKEQWAKINFKIFRDQFIFITLYFYRMYKDVLHRKQNALNTKGERAIKCLQNFLEMFQKNCGRTIVQFASNKESLDITDKRKILEAEMTKRKQNIKAQTKKLFQTLMSNFNAKDIKQETIEFLGSMMHDFEFPVQNFLFIFEINRFGFSAFGQIKNMTDIKSQCLLITLILIRVFIIRIIMKPWAEFPDRVKKKELFQQNCHIVGSLMYEIMMDYVKIKWPKVTENQKYLSSEYKTFPRPLGPLLAETYQLPDEVAEIRNIRQNEEPLILGLAERENLVGILDDDKPFCQEMQKIVQQWTETIYKIVHQDYLVKQKAKRLARFQEKLQFIETNFFNKAEEKEKYIQLAQKKFDDYESILPQPAEEQT